MANSRRSRREFKKPVPKLSKLRLELAGARFGFSLIRALNGEQNVIECCNVRSNITEAKYFFTPVLIGKNGIEKNLGLGKMNAFEKKLLQTAIRKFKKTIQKVEDLVNKK